MNLRYATAILACISLIVGAHNIESYVKNNNPVDRRNVLIARITLCIFAFIILRSLSRV